VPGPVSRVLSKSQLATLAAKGEERSAEVGEKLYEIGDATYPFIAILEGEAVVLDAAGNEIVRHGPSGFLGEMNLLSGQTVFLTAVVTEPMRYVAVDRVTLRDLLFEDSTLSDMLLSEPAIAGLPVVPTVHVPLARRSPTRITISGAVPAPALRELVIERVRREAALRVPDYEIEDSLVVDPQVWRRAA